MSKSLTELLGERSTRKIVVDVEFCGDGSIREIEPNTFFGGVATEVEGQSRFRCYDEVVDENGVRNPKGDGVTTPGHFQVQIDGDARFFYGLGRLFLALAELDVSVNPDYTIAFRDLRSEDGNTCFHIRLRKAM